MAKRMLVIADSNALWTKRFLEHVALPAGYEVVLFPIWGHKGKFDDFYRENNVTVYIDKHTLPVIRHIPRVRMWARIVANARKLIAMGPFDVVHNHYISQRDLALGRLVSRKFGAKWVASIWGSDLLRVSDAEKKRMKPLLLACDHVHTVTENMGEKLTALCGPELQKKLVIADFGQTSYRIMDELGQKYTKAECKQFFGMDPDSFCLCIGYSASRAQQQLKVLEAVAKMPRELLKKITVVLQQTYCVDDEAYLAKTREAAADLPCRHVFLSDFMNDEECARLRIASDAFVLSITTDALSSTLMDYLYSGSCVLVGDWLEYPVLDEWRAAPHRFSFEELPELLVKAVQGELTGLPEENRKVFPQKTGWETLLPYWLAMYE